MKGRVRLTNFAFTRAGVDADLELLADVAPEPTPTPVPEPTPVPVPVPVPVLPVGYNSDPHVAFGMFTHAMDVHGLTPIGVQGHGQQIIDAITETWPGLRVYLSPSDAPVWPGFGSLDVTIDSGKGGWSFRPDGVTPYV